MKVLQHLAGSAVCAVLIAACSGPQAAGPAKTPFEQALADRDGGRLPEAEAKLEALADGGDERARVEWIETLLLRGKHAQAVERLKPMFEAHREDPRWILLLARAHDGAGNADEAIALYGRLLQHNPSDGPIALRLADLMVSRGDVVGACTVAEAALQREPDNVALLVTFSRALLGRGRLPQALAQAQRATTLAPSDPQAWFQLAQVQMMAGDLDKARDSLELSVKFDAQFGDALRDLGIVLLELGDTKKAVQVLRHASQVAPDSGVVWTALGIARHRDKDLVGAIAALETALRLQPQAVQAYVSLAEVSLDNGQPRRAQTEARKGRDRLGSQATADVRARVEGLLLRAVVVANLADALCRNRKDADAVQSEITKELKDDGLERLGPEAAKVGADATAQIRAAQARCATPETKTP
jgi:Flp pilus assembly protein TadD